MTSIIYYQNSELCGCLEAQLGFRYREVQKRVINSIYSREIIIDPQYDLDFNQEFAV